MSLSCFFKIHIREKFCNIISHLISVVFDNEPQTVAVAKAVRIELSNLLTVNATHVVGAVVAIDDGSISFISTMYSMFHIYL